MELQNRNRTRKIDRNNDQNENEGGRRMYTVILTGGSSRRMGRDKALLPYDGGTFLQTLIDRFSQGGPVGVSVDRAGRFPIRGAAELVDGFPGQGPLNGVVSGFRATTEDALLLTAVDLPFADPALASKLNELRGGADVCALRFGPKRIEPLFAIYGRGCLAPAEECLSKGRRSLLALFECVSVRYAVPEELPGFDLSRIFTNVNTPED